VFYPSPVKVDKDRQMVVLEDELQVRGWDSGHSKYRKMSGDKVGRVRQGWISYLINRAP
jgi:hypothetical protein